MHRNERNDQPVGEQPDSISMELRVLWPLGSDSFQTGTHEQYSRGVTNGSPANVELHMGMCQNTGTLKMVGVMLASL